MAGREHAARWAEGAGTTAPAPPAARALPLRPVTLTEPVPGFPAHRDYVLVPADTGGLRYWLQSVAVDGPRFLVVPPEAHVPGYAPALPAAVRAELGPGELRLLCLVTVPGGDARAATLNLRAPLVLAPATGRARQVLLADGGHPIRHPVRR